MMGEEGFLWPLDQAYSPDDWAKHGIDPVDAEAMTKVEGAKGPKPRAKVLADNLATAKDRKVDMVNLPPHYARFKIEPIRFIGENKLDWFQGNIIKYVCRHDAKNGQEDIAKVIRYAQMYQLYLAGDPDWWRAGKPEDFLPNG